MRFYALPIHQLVLRFYLMMGIILLAGFSGYFLLGLLALPVFLSAMLGISFHLRPRPSEVADPVPASRVVELPMAPTVETPVEQAA